MIESRTLKFDRYKRNENFLKNNLIRNLKAPLLNVNSDIDEILRLNRYLLSFIGAWPLEANASYFARSFSIFRIITTGFLLVLSIIPQFITIYIHWGDVNLVSDVGSTMLPFLVLFFKLLYVVFRQNDCHVLYEFIRKFWRLAKNQEERNNIVELANHARIFTYSLSYLGAVDVPLFIIGSFLITLHNYVITNGTDYYHKLPLFIDCGYDTQISPNYEILFIIQTLTLVFVAVGTIGVDGAMMAMIMHVAAQFRLISLRLKAVGQRIANGAVFENKVDNKLRMEVDLCILHHQKILSMFQYVDSLLGPVILYQLLQAALEICFVGWSLIELDNDMVSTIKFVLLLAAVSLQLSIWCWSGEMIIQESSNIGLVVFYNIPWLTLPTSVQRDLMLIICRTQKSCELTALGLQVMCMEKLTEVFSSVLSYMALLRSMKEK